MRLCPKCRKKPWPYLIILFISSFAAFLTWLTLSTTDTTAQAIPWWSALAFVAVAGLLLVYMLSCMRRHCRQDRHTA